jgi:hypothetical protein
MKTKKLWLSQVLMIASFAVLSSLTLNSCDKDDDDNNNNNNRAYTISGNASGSQMVPSVAGSGTGTISGTYDPNTRMFNYTTNWSGLTGAPTSGGFYSGNSGVAGTAVGTPWTFASGTTATGTQSGSMTLTQDQANQMLGGGWYYSLGTATNTNGEVRGQISATRQ